ncbi:PadR family transcriptional regulator [Cohnella hashimotonis]|uniref:Helix-turn-helix transcriptional regulator n=1 Tax=Cohnella hashimotonis TaxID=2826895 RepID=A0ABT6TQ36_9BACL|nr:helix-turn-helix transcriptional regulator [Cohnella hashimotonis]MDI4648963.1 helix-turn-helix transcriptional regulator [Cohnella hashimotonis]
MDKSKQMLPLTEAFYYILVTLCGEPAHGYGMMQEVERMSGGRLKLGAGTLYTALNTLQGKGLIEPHPGAEGADARRKVYAITGVGREVLAAEVGRLEELLVVGRLALNGGD